MAEVLPPEAAGLVVAAVPTPLRGPDLLPVLALILALILALALSPADEFPARVIPSRPFVK